MNAKNYFLLLAVMLLGSLSTVKAQEERKEEIDQIEIMSYSDSEWSDGDVYNKLGFSAHSHREPVGFIVDNSTYKRIHFNKIGRDRAFPKELLDDPNKFTLIYNIGSTKFISRYK